MKKIIFSLILSFAFILNSAQTTEPKPIVIVQNVVMGNLTLNSLDPNKIEQVQVYKTPSTETAKFDDLIKNGLINITLKEKMTIESLTISEAKKRFKLPANALVFLNDIAVHDENILIAEDLLKTSSVIDPDKKTNNYSAPVLKIKTD
ncbi:hypothetical protein [Epilithonimonas lactis]|uniref:Uncharacterized protein n=1 Tax=Epilithonimonas lactis TaxID=421072 RepID=A0A085BH73_9FLAO|nr:hypothetical protein [Epilithonimonas lactis]KFC21818.1 hypothetical protein IO89_07470 [Epilithonimonas lactis]SEQ45458.1 hypothetical protein SAMN04488097_2106 [Epilithonimonas lactis]